MDIVRFRLCMEVLGWLLLAACVVYMIAAATRYLRWRVRRWWRMTQRKWINEHAGRRPTDIE